MADNDALRQQAEALSRKNAGQSPENIEALSPEEMRQTLHELRVHQIELEMQNEELRRTQLELDAARARYFDLYDLAPVGYVTLSEPGLILEANLTAATLLGVARSVARGVRASQPIFSRFILKEDLGIYYRHRKQIFEAGEPTLPAKSCELRMVKQDGTIFWARLESIATHDPSTSSGQATDGAPVLRVVLSDITERKRADLELVSAHESLKEAHRLAHIGTWDWVMENDTVTWSAELYNIAGRDPSLPAPTYAEQPRVYTPASWDLLSGAVTRALTTGEPYNLELKLVRPDGSLRWANAFGGVKRDGEGKVIGLQGTLQDITERHQAEESLRASEQKLQTIFDLLPVGVSILDSDRRIVEINAALERILDLSWAGLQAGQYLQRRYLRRDGQPMPAADFPSNRAVAEGRPVHDVEIGVVKEDDTLIWTNVSAAPLPGSRVVVTTTDITDRIRMEDALRESEEKYRVIFNNEIYAICIFDLETLKLLDANEAYVHLYGYSREELVSGMTIHDITAEHQASDAATTQATREGTTYIPLRYHRKKDGTIFPVEIVGGPYVWQGRKVMFGLAHDIAARQQAKEALTHSHDLLRYIIEHNRSAIAVHDRDLKYVYVSQRYLDDYQVKEKDVIGKHHYDVFPDLPQKWRDVHQKALAGEISSAEDDPYVRADGTVDWTRWECRPWYEADGSIGGIIIYTEIITDRKQAEETIKNTLRFQQVLMDAVPAPIFYKDAECVYLGGNQAFERYIGLTPEQFIGKTVYDISPVDLAEKYDQADRELLNNRGVQTYEASVVYADATRHDVIFNKAAFTDAEGKVAGLIGVILDITERKQIEDALRDLNATLEQRVADRTRRLAEANARLSELDRLKDDFIARISHELRTPLTSIKIYLEMLDTVKPEKRARYMQVLTEQTNRLQQLIESLLEVTQTSGSAAGIRVAPTDLNKLVVSLAADITPRAAERGLTLTTALTPDLPFASAEALSLAQILSKLAANALNYTPVGGTIDLSTAEVIDAGETWITFTIRDSGPGVALDEQAHIFDRFYRGRAAADYKNPGAGIGLSISRDLLTLMEGRLTVDSRPGEGAAFTAWLKPA